MGFLKTYLHGKISDIIIIVKKDYKKGIKLKC
jgi:hypothetical protein